MIQFQRERIHDLWSDLAPLIEQHWREVAYYQDIALKPDTKRYELMEDAGVLRCYTAREDGRLIGYAFYFVMPHLHYADSLTAMQDVLFIEPEQRKGRLGFKLIAWCDDRLRDERVQVVTHHVKIAPHLNFGNLLARMGYEPTDMLWSRRLDQ